MSQHGFSSLAASARTGGDLTAILEAIQSGHIGTARPSYAEKGMLWAKDIPGSSLVEIYFCYTDTQDTLIGTVDTVTGAFEAVTGNSGLAPPRLAHSSVLNVNSTTPVETGAVTTPEFYEIDGILDNNNAGNRNLVLAFYDGATWGADQLVNVGRDVGYFANIKIAKSGDYSYAGSTGARNTMTVGSLTLPAVVTKVRFSTDNSSFTARLACWVTEQAA